MKRTERKKSVSVQKVFEWIYADEFDPEAERAINDPLLAESCRRDLMKRWNVAL